MSDYKGLREELDKAFLQIQKGKWAKEDHRKVVAEISKDIIDSLTPVLESIAQNSRISQSELRKILSEMKFDIPTPKIPDIDTTSIRDAITESIQEAFNNINIPTPQVDVRVPTPKVNVSVPEIKVPQVNIPPVNFPSVMKTELMGVNYGKPLPVILTDNKGNPYIAGSSGGKGGSPSVITDITGPGGRSIIDESENAIKVTGANFNIEQLSGAVDSINVVQINSLSTGFNSGVVNDGVMRVVNVTDVGTSVNVIGFTGSIGATILNGDGNSLDPRDRNWTITEGLEVKQISGTTDSMNVVSSVTLDTKQLSGSVDSIEITSQPFSLDVKQVSGSTDSVNIVSSVTLDVKQLSGSTDSVVVTGFNTSIGASILNGDGNALDPRDRNWTITETVPISSANTLDVKQVSGANWSIEIASQPFTLDVKQVSGSIDSINVAQQDITLAIRQVSGANHSIEIASQPFTLDIKQVSGSVDSTNVLQLNGTTVNTDQGYSYPGTLRVVHATDIITSVNVAQQDLTLAVRQVSGSIDSIEITSQPFSLDVKQVSGSTDSINVLQINSLSTGFGSGVDNSGVLRVVHVTDVATSVRGISNDGVDIGDVTINNAAGASAVNIQDGGNSITVDGTVTATQGTTPWVNNITQVGSNAISVNTGSSDNGTLRTVLAHSSNSTTTSVSVGADASTNLVLTTAERKSVMFTHASSSNLYISTGTAASTTSFPIKANQIVGFEDYTGPVNAIAEEQAGTISVRYIEVA